VHPYAVVELLCTPIIVDGYDPNNLLGIDLNIVRVEACIDVTSTWVSERVNDAH
jgi:hypothetical protein